MDEETRIFLYSLATFENWDRVCVKYSKEYTIKILDLQMEKMEKRHHIEKIKCSWGNVIKFCNNLWQQLGSKMAKTGADHFWGTIGTIGFQLLSSSPSLRALQSPLLPSSYFSPRIPSWHNINDKVHWFVYCVRMDHLILPCWWWKTSFCGGWNLVQTP